MCAVVVAVAEVVVAVVVVGGGGGGGGGDDDEVVVGVTVLERCSKQRFKWLTNSLIIVQLWVFIWDSE